MSDEAFSVWIILPDDSHACVRSNVGAREAVETAKDFSQRPAATIGVIRRIIITDADDFTNFEWRYGEGVTYPPRGESNE